MLKLKLTRIEEDGTEKVLCDEEVNNIAVLSESDDTHIMELLANLSIKDLCFMIMQSNKFIEAAKLAVIGDKIMKVVKHSDAEQELIDQIDGGLQ